MAGPVLDDRVGDDLLGQGQVGLEEGRGDGLGVPDVVEPERGVVRVDGVPLSFSPDGSRMVLIRRVDGGTDVRVTAMADPNEPSPWLRVPSFVRGAPWSPDGARVVLTGGASQLVGVRETAARVLGRQVRLGRPHPVRGLPETFHAPAFATTLGLLAWGGGDGRPVLDLDYAEDSVAETDSNFVITGSGGIVEVQGTAEGKPFSEEEFLHLLRLAKAGVAQLVDLQKKAVA